MLASRPGSELMDGIPLTSKASESEPSDPARFSSQWQCESSPELRNPREKLRWGNPPPSLSPLCFRKWLSAKDHLPQDWDKSQGALWLPVTGPDKILQIPMLSLSKVLSSQLEQNSYKPNFSNAFLPPKRWPTLRLGHRQVGLRERPAFTHIPSWPSWSPQPLPPASSSFVYCSPWRKSLFLTLEMLADLMAVALFSLWQ